MKSFKNPNKFIKKHPLFTLLLIIFFCLIGLILLLLAVLWQSGNLFTVSFNTAPFIFGALKSDSSIVSSACDSTLWDRVYGNDRLLKITPCISVTGTIDRIENVDDGDSHILVKLDSQYSNLPNFFNLIWGGDLVVEVICQGPIDKDNDAIRSCQGYKNHIVVPPSGTRVKVTGTYALDKSYGWKEIHPVSLIEIWR